MSAPPPPLIEQVHLFVSERTGYSDEVIARVLLACEQFWRTREPALLLAMEARLTQQPDRDRG